MRRLIPTAVLALALAGPALADPPPLPAVPTPPKMFLSPAGEPFRATPAAPDPFLAWFQGADTGHLGYLDRAEFDADAARFFKKLDENGDGVIDGFEVQDYEKSVPELVAQSEGLQAAEPGGRGPQGGGQGSGPGGGHRDGQGGGGRPGQGAGAPPRGAQRVLFVQLLDEPEPVVDADYDVNSRITMDEWMRAANQRFDLLDEHRDGRLTLDELRARLPKPAPVTPANH